jgi:proteasome accessory factor A
MVPRSVPVENLIAGLMPLFVARQVLCGAGKVGAESGAWCDFQMSQRADFFSEPVNAETLYRRPVFNTRDEPHADPAKWVRLHVICGESNMVSTGLLLKVALTKAALHLLETGRQPIWRLSDPVRAIKEVSRALDTEGRIDLEGKSWTTPRQVLESYVAAFLESTEGDADPLALELRQAMSLALRLLQDRFTDPDRFARSVDWAAKRSLLMQYAEAEDVNWRDPVMQSLDLEYHRIDGRQGLFFALEGEGIVDTDPDPAEVETRRHKVCEPTRARARSIAVTKFRSKLVSASWGTLTLRTPKGDVTLQIPPDADYPETMAQAETVESLIMETEAR